MQTGSPSVHKIKLSTSVMRHINTQNVRSRTLTKVAEHRSENIIKSEIKQPREKEIKGNKNKRETGNNNNSNCNKDHNWKRNFLAVHLIRPAPDTLDILYKAGDVASQSRNGIEGGGGECGRYKLNCPAGCGKFGGTSSSSPSSSSSATSCWT